MARQVQDRIASSGDAVTKADRSPVTVADLAIQVLVSHRLAERYPADGLLAEEDTAAIDAEPALAAQVLELSRQAVPGLTADAMRRALGRGNFGGGAARHWILDPIDGTKGFLRGEQYAVALALIEDGERRGSACSAARTLPGGRPGARRRSSAPRRVRGHRAAGSGRVRGPAGRGRRHHRPRRGALLRVGRVGARRPVRVRPRSRSARHPPRPVRIDSQCKYAVVARGEASIYLRLPTRADYREKIWDHAAGTLIVEAAGGRRHRRRRPAARRLGGALPRAQPRHRRHQRPPARGRAGGLP